MRLDIVKLCAAADEKPEHRLDRRYKWEAYGYGSHLADYCFPICVKDCPRCKMDE